LVGFQRDANRRIGEQMRAIRDGRTTGALLTGLMLAFLYGAVHAAGPGHGKLVVVTYFLSREARFGRGLLMGAQIALAHVVSAVIIVTFADFLLRRAFGGVPAEIPAVRAASYGLIFLVGAVMLVRAIRAARRGSTAHGHDHHGHDHGHAACGCAPRRGEGGLLSLGVGLVPCTGSVLILLYAFANGILWAGLLLVGMVALGMAVTMGALGLLSVLARRLVVARLPGAGGARTLAAVEILGAALVATFGLALLATSV
jgi:ABC-type nickel/cobalt efflux system permease component RcnA